MADNHSKKFASKKSVTHSEHKFKAGRDRQKVYCFLKAFAIEKMYELAGVS